MDFLISTLLLHGLNKYYGLNENPDVLINGSSMTMSGFNRKNIKHLANKEIAIYAHEGVSINERYFMIEHFFEMYPASVENVVYELNPIIFSKIKTAGNVYTIFYPYMDYKNINKYIKKHASVKEFYVNKFIRTKRFDSRLIRLIMMGYLDKYDNLKTIKLDTLNLSSLITHHGATNIILEKTSIEIFEKTMDLISSNNSRIILVMMPMFYMKLQTFDNEDYNNLCQYFKDYCSSSDNIHFLNLNQDSIIYNADYFSDQYHFNVYGQRLITKVISSYLADD